MFELESLTANVIQMKSSIEYCKCARLKSSVLSILKSDAKRIYIITVYLVVGVILGISGCTDIKGPTVPTIDDSDAFASLSFTTKVAYIQKGDTLPLRLIATAADGSSIPVNINSVSWSSSDSSLVHVDSLGRIVARGVTLLPVDIVAVYRHSFTTRTDTVQVYVTFDEFQAATVRMIAIDSARVGTGALYTGTFPRLKVELRDGNGDLLNIGKLPLSKPGSISTTYNQTAGPSGEPVYLINSSGRVFGKFWIKASFNFYGVEVRDSVEFTGTHRYGLPLHKVVESSDGVFSFDGPDGAGRLSIQPCGVISFALEIFRAVDIVFSDSASSSGGCEPLSEAGLGTVIYYGDIYKGDFIGGNLLNIQPGLSWYFRRSNSKGELNWYVRDATTKEPIPIGGRFQVIDVH